MSAFTDLVDLAAERIGGRALAASDEFFAEKENLLKPGRGVFIADKYTDRGKWMDGWESRRRRTPGHDWCIVKLGLPGIIRGIDVDTHHFTGNYPEHASLDACEADPDAGADALARADWQPLVPRSRLEGTKQNLFPVTDERRFTHVRLNIFPDGGVARLRVHGEVLPDWPRLRAAGGLIDLAAIENGGTGPICNDMFFSHKDNLIMPGAPINMGDGWETKRKRGPGHDWLIVKLGCAGTIQRVEVDTTHFKGNYPDRCSLEGVDLRGELPVDFLGSRSIGWQELLPSVKLEAHTRHTFERELKPGGPYTHIRLNIFPDGGIGRLRLHGVPA
jgi:allantoicase